jgi:hypothetical protein
VGLVKEAVNDIPILGEAEDSDDKNKEVEYL